MTSVWAGAVIVAAVAATPSHVTGVDFALDRPPFAVPRPPGATADAAFGTALLALARPPGPGPRSVVAVVTSSADDWPSSHALPAGPGRARFGRLRLGDWRLFAADGRALQAYRLDRGRAGPRTRSGTTRRPASRGRVRLRAGERNYSPAAHLSPDGPRAPAAECRESPGGQAAGPYALDDTATWRAVAAVPRMCPRRAAAVLAVRPVVRPHDPRRVGRVRRGRRGGRTRRVVAPAGGDDERVRTRREGRGRGPKPPRRRPARRGRTAGGGGRWTAEPPVTAAGRDWVTRVVPADDAALHVARWPGLPVPPAQPSGATAVVFRVDDAAANRPRCWSPRPLPKPVTLPFGVAWAVGRGDR